MSNDRPEIAQSIAHCSLLIVWMRAEDRNHATATAYNALGLAEYEAMEAFVRHKIQ